MSLTKIESSDIGSSNLYFRNLIINGNMNVHQRGTSSLNRTGGDYFAADRWSHNITNSGTWNITVENDAPIGTGLNKSLKTTCAVAKTSLGSNDVILIQQFLEGQNVQILKTGTSSSESITVSFWVKSNLTGIYNCEISTTDTRFNSRNYTITSANVWEKKTITYSGDTVVALLNDNNYALRLVFWCAGGSSFTNDISRTSWNTSQGSRAVNQVNLAATVGNYFQVTGVQMEVGVVATPFEILPIDIQLQRCLRYYAIFTITTDYSDGYNNGVLYRSYNLPVTMRTNPTGFSIINQFQYYSSGTPTNFTPTFAAVSRLSFTVFGSGLTAGRGIFGGTVGVNAEL
jgi:hypothetical protein